MAKTTQTQTLLPGLDPRAPSFEGAAGIDEVGRGCLAGPVVACALLLPRGYTRTGLTDSKKLSPAKREELAPLLQQDALAYGLGVVEAARIDAINILQATFEAMTKALLAMGKMLITGMPCLPLPGSCGATDTQIKAQPDARADVLMDAHTLFAALPKRVAVDGNKTIPADVLTRILVPALTRETAEAERLAIQLAVRPPFRQTAVIGGDAKVAAISAASILAKVYRDHHMEQLETVYPGYGFAAHKGYGTKDHLDALRRLGPCPEHRRSFRGVLQKPEQGQTQG